MVDIVFIVYKKVERLESVTIKAIPNSGSLKVKVGIVKADKTIYVDVPVVLIITIYITKDNRKAARIRRG